MYVYQVRCFLNEKVCELFYCIYCFSSYSAWTTLSVVHTHYLILYHVRLNMTVMMLVVRGIVQVTQMHVVSAVISGIAGIGHILLGVSLILILIQIKHAGKD